MAADADARLDPTDLDADAAARGGVYGVLARAFDHPDEALHAALVDGSLAAAVDAMLARTALDATVAGIETGDDHDTLCARYNDAFVVGFSEYENPMDGSLDATGPPVPLYESAHRPDVSWTDVNLDLARAYDYYDVAVATENREHHDHLRLECEFAGYLARREASVDGDDAAAARLDFLDRHLRPLVEGVVGAARDEPGLDCYRGLVDLLDAFTAADRDDLADRLAGDSA